MIYRERLPAPDGLVRAGMRVDVSREAVDEAEAIANAASEEAEKLRQGAIAQIAGVGGAPVQQPAIQPPDNMPAALIRAGVAGPNNPEND